MIELTKYTKDTLKTTTDCVKAAEQIKEEAKQVTSREEHSKWWDNKVDFVRFINGLLETGGFDGDAYEELMTCKTIVYYAEIKAGGYEA